MCGEVRRERSHHSQSNTLVNLGLSPPITAGSLILDPESGFPVYHLWKPEPDWVGAGEAGALPFDASSTNQKPGFPAGGKIHTCVFWIVFLFVFVIVIVLLLCCHYQLSHWTTFQPIREDYSQLAGTESWCLGCKCDPPVSKRKNCAKLWCLWSLHFHKNIARVVLRP